MNVQKIWRYLLSQQVLERCSTGKGRDKKNLPGQQLESEVLAKATLREGGELE